MVVVVVVEVDVTVEVELDVAVGATVVEGLVVVIGAVVVIVEETEVDGVVLDPSDEQAAIAKHTVSRDTARWHRDSARVFTTPTIRRFDAAMFDPSLARL